MKKIFKKSIKLAILIMIITNLKIVDAKTINTNIDNYLSSDSTDMFIILLILSIISITGIIIFTHKERTK